MIHIKLTNRIPAFENLNPVFFLIYALILFLNKEMEKEIGLGAIAYINLDTVVRGELF